jgi:hypothetical protein
MQFRVAAGTTLWWLPARLLRCIRLTTVVVLVPHRQTLNLTGLHQSMHKPNTQTELVLAVSHSPTPINMMTATTSSSAAAVLARVHCCPANNCYQLGRCTSLTSTSRRWWRRASRQSCCQIGHPSSASNMLLLLLCAEDDDRP